MYQYQVWSLEADPDWVIEGRMAPSPLSRDGIGTDDEVGLSESLEWAIYFKGAGQHLKEVLTCA